MSDERGSVSLLAMAAAALAVVLCVGVGRVGGAALLQARADTAADAAALAGADSLAMGLGGREAARAAADAARHNGAVLERCDCGSTSAEVVVRIGRAHGHARAEVDVNGVRVSAP